MSRNDIHTSGLTVARINEIRARHRREEGDWDDVDDLLKAVNHLTEKLQAFEDNPVCVYLRDLEKRVAELEDGAEFHWAPRSG